MIFHMLCDSQEIKSNSHGKPLSKPQTRIQYSTKGRVLSTQVHSVAIPPYIRLGRSAASTCNLPPGVVNLSLTPACNASRPQSRSTTILKRPQLATSSSSSSKKKGELSPQSTPRGSCKDDPPTPSLTALARRLAEMGILNTEIRMRQKLLAPSLIPALFEI